MTRGDDVRAAATVPYRLLEAVLALDGGDRDAANMPIKGDNLNALLPHYKGALKCIYIDPPYDTRSARLMMANHLPADLAGKGFGIGAFAFTSGTGFAWNGGTYSDPALAGQVVGKGTYSWDGAAGPWFWIDPVPDIVFVGMIQQLAGSGPPLQEVTRPVVYQALDD